MRKLKNRRNTDKKLNTSDSSQDLKSILGKAVQLHQSGSISEAEVLYSRILSIDPDHADALHLTGLIAFQRGDNRLAVEYIEKAISKNPAVFLYYNNMGSALLNLKEHEKAVECFEEAISLNPDYAEACSNLGNAFRELGRINDAMDYYQKAISLNPAHSAAHNNLANTYKAQGNFDKAADYYKKAISLNPDFAEAYFNLGSTLYEASNFDESVRYYHKAIAIRPNFAEAYNGLGNALKKQGKYEEAVTHYKKALTLNPNFAEAFNNLGDAFKEQGRYDDAVEQCNRALSLKPDAEELYVNLGNALLAQGNVKGAVSEYQKAITLNPDYADAHYNKSLVLLMTGEFEEGWNEYEWRFKSKEIAIDIGCKDQAIPLWDGSYLEDKTILILSEQGIGDTIQFARYIHMVKERCNKIVFEYPEGLERLLKSCKAIDSLTAKPYKKESELTPDVCINLLSLPGISTDIGPIPADVPYLKAAAEEVNKWKPRIKSEQLKVGIVWAGNSAHKNDRNRSCRISDFARLSTVPGIAWYSLQKGDGSEQVKDIPDGMNITDLGGKLADFLDTAAVISNLDLIISVDTAVVHLAGALGKQVWTLLPFVPDWRWMLNREDTPWYPTMTLLRQPKPGDWQSVFERVADKLEKYLRHFKDK